MPAERYPPARWYPGPTWKQGYDFAPGPNRKRGIVPHSMEGSLAGALSVLEGPRHSSWQFSITTLGAIYQHYNVTADCWHGADVDNDDNVRANLDLIGIEDEGFAGQMLAGAQVITLAHLYSWLQDEHGFQPYVRLQTVYEHGEVADSWTECPSGRIPHQAVAGTIAQLRDEHLGEEKKEMALVMIKKASDPKVWLTDWLWRRWILSNEEVQALRYMGIPGPVTVADGLLNNIQPV